MSRLRRWTRSLASKCMRMRSMRAPVARHRPAVPRVAHDVDEAIVLGDGVLVMRDR
jgi:ABC-type nitrate/sulfonate/bicarbonate transport system ATPase subunit